MLFVDNKQISPGHHGTVWAYFQLNQQDPNIAQTCKIEKKIALSKVSNLAEYLYHV